LAENLEHIDVALIDRAEREIDMAAYVLTDWPIPSFGRGCIASRRPHGARYAC
jgi:hypothetical protein